MRLAVVGAGYVGTVTAACLAHSGNVVTLVERSAARVAALKAGRLPFYEPGLDELVARELGEGRLSVADDTGVRGSPEVIFICVGTPLAANGEADLSQVAAACRSAVMHGARDIPVVVRSTLPLGTTPLLVEWLDGIPLDLLATNPEFLRQGSAVADFLDPTRIVIGTSDGAATTASAAVLRAYAGIEAPTILTDYVSAEMIKSAANAFLALRLAFINEVADLAEAYDADIEQVVTGIGLDPRIGPHYLRPGIGFGGSCLPKEMANLVRLGRRERVVLRTLEAAGQSNDERPRRIADRLDTITGGLHGIRVALLGLAFKAGTDDTRYSPAIALALELLARGAVVVAHDPVVPMTVSSQIEGLLRTQNAADAIAGTDLVVLATEWPIYQELDWTDLANQARTPVIFDGRNALDPVALTESGWQIARVGFSKGPDEIGKEHVRTAVNAASMGAERQLLPPHSPRYIPERPPR